MQEKCFFTHGYQMKPLTIRPVFRGTHLLLLVLALVVLYAEWWDPEQQLNTWPHIRRRQHLRDQSTVLLLVADAHLDWLSNDSLFSLSHWTNKLADWDLERCLRRWFSAALTHIQPDIVVFLGDTMAPQIDSMTPQQCADLSERFWWIFPVAENIEIISVPEVLKVGDSDGQTSFPEKCSSLRRLFSPHSSAFRHSRVDFVRFLAVNSVNDIANLTLLAVGAPSRLNLLVSHYPITASVKSQTLNILNELRVNLIFSAHNHNSYVAARSKLRHEHVYQRHSISQSESQHFSLNDEDVVEIVVPTCNYRSGVKRSGFGVASIEKGGSLNYAVLWLPSRHKHLAIYLATLLSCSTILVGCFLCSRRMRRSQRRFCLRSL